MRILDLEKLAGAFTTNHGFSRPCWRVLLHVIDRYHSPEEKLSAWTDVAAQWASRWKAELGKDFWIAQSGTFSLVSQLDRETAERTLQRANRFKEKISDVLGPVAWEDRPEILLVQIADEFLARRLDDAVSSSAEQTYTEQAADRGALTWILMGSRDETLMIYDLQSGLVWGCLSHLPLPRWVTAGVAIQLWRAFDVSAGQPPRELFDADLIPEHRSFWNETTIQSFWAGTCRTEYPDQSHLERELSQILIHLLSEKTASLTDFLRCAHEYDAGKSAARVCLKIDLGELAGTFLGPGCWTPRPLAVAESWDRIYAGPSDRTE